MLWNDPPREAQLADTVDCFKRKIYCYLHYFITDILLIYTVVLVQLEHLF